MAKVARTESAANLSTAQKTARLQADAVIDAVTRAYDKAISMLSGGFILGQSTGEKQATSTLRALRGTQAESIDSWIARGRAAADDNSWTQDQWNKWTARGKVYEEGINNIADTGIHLTAKVVIATIKEAPATTAKAIQKAAVAVEQAGSSIAWGIAKPVIAGLAAYVVLRMTVLR